MPGSARAGECAIEINAPNGIVIGLSNGGRGRAAAAGVDGAGGAMITPPPGRRVWLAAGRTDMRKSFDGPGDAWLVGKISVHRDQRVVSITRFRQFSKPKQL